MNISFQEILMLVVLVLIVVAVVWWVIRLVKGFGDGYRSAGRSVPPSGERRETPGVEE